MTGAAASTPDWNKIYLSKGESDVSWYQQAASTSISLLDRLSVPASASVLDVGAGASRFVDAVLDRGHTQVTALDLAMSGLEIARRRLGPRGAIPTWHAADLLRWRPARPFDIWHDRAVFHFLTKYEDRRRYRDTLMASTAAESLVILATFAPDGPTRCSGRTVERYSADALAHEIGAGFDVVLSDREAHITPTGVAQPFTWLVLRRL